MPGQHTITPLPTLSGLIANGDNVTQGSRCARTRAEISQRLRRNFKIKGVAMVTGQPCYSLCLIVRTVLQTNA